MQQQDDGSQSRDQPFQGENQRYRNELKEVPSTDWERLHDLAQKEQELTRKLQRWTAEWVKLSEELES